MVDEIKRCPLYIQDVYKQYGNKLVLDDIDLKVSPGEFVTVVGPSGCGKSTLLRLILGQERVTSGDIYLNNKPIGYANTTRGIVYQKYSLFPHLNVLENIMLGLNLRAGFFEERKRKQEFTDMAMHFIEKVRLTGNEYKMPSELSGGMQQRVAIAQALIMNPKILLMDEPFGALDPGTREDLQVFITELWEEYKMIIFFVTHSLTEACFLGSRIIVLSQFYNDDRGPNANRGATIVHGSKLGWSSMGTGIKKSLEFNEFKETLRRDGFDQTYIQHLDDFNLTHPDSFSTVSSEYSKNGSGSK